MPIKEVDQKSYDELIDDLQHRYGRLHTRFDLHIVGEDESPSELAELKGLIESLNVEDENLNKKIDEINKRFETIEVGDIDLSGYVKKSELPDLLPETGHLLTESEADGLYAKKTDIPQLQDLTEYAKKSELPDTSNLLSESEADGLYAKKTDIPQLQDLTEYAKKSELPDTSNLLSESEADGLYAKKTDIPQLQDLTEYAKKSELPDVSNLLTDYQADAKYVLNTELSTYARKTDIPQPQDLSEYAKKSELPTETTDLSIYALKTDLENLPQGGTTLSAVEISKKLTLNGVVDYDQLMDSRLVFVNDSDKPITITIQEYDSNSNYVTKDHTFQPQEEWLHQYGGFKPAKAEGTYPTLILKVDGVVQNNPRSDLALERWPLKAYIHPYHLREALYRSIM